MNRTEHMKWAKQRAKEEAARSGPAMGLTSLASDLNKHPETQGNICVGLGMGLLRGGFLDTPSEFNKFIDDIN